MTERPPRTVAVLLVGLAAASLARAQTTADDDRSRPGSQFTLGAVAAYVPRYEGADEMRLRPLPLLSYRNGRFFAGALGGIGYDFSPTPGLSFGPLLSYRFGRDEDDSGRLRGLGDVEGGLDSGAFVRWNLQPFFLHANLRHGLTGDGKGTQVRLGGGYTARLAPADVLVLDLSADWADRKVMQSYFGIDAGQSARSGLPAYDAGSGIRRYGASLIWTHAFSTQWSTSVGATVYRLGHEATGSPIVQRRTVPAASVAVGYRF